MKQKNRRSSFRGLLVFLAIAVIITFVMNYEVSIKQGVNGHNREIRMPLYVKCAEFLTRNYEYGRIAKEIGASCKTDEEKAVAALLWTAQNLKDVPPGMPIVDDHILNIIIRGYGVPEQFQDVFTTLCSYSGMPAFWDKFESADGKVKYAISFVKIDGDWRAFDAYRGKYFRNKNGKIASIDDILRDASLVRGEDIDDLTVRGVPYRDFYRNLDLRQIRDSITLRPYRQMPMRRFLFEIRKALGMEKEYKIEDKML